MANLFNFVTQPLHDILQEITTEKTFDPSKGRRKKYGEAKIYVIPLAHEDLIFSPIAQLKCIQCGFYGRTYHCGPWVASYKKWQERLKNYNLLLLVAGYIDVTPRIKENITKFGTDQWKAHYFAGSEGTMIIVSEVKKHTKHIINLIAPHAERYIDFDAGGGCRRCRSCGKHTGEPCRHPKEANPSPEAAGIELYTLLPQLLPNFQIPPQNIYYSVKLVAFKINNPNFDPHDYVKPHHISLPQTTIKVPEATNFYEVNSIYNPDVKLACRSCKFKSDFICPVIDPNDLYNRIKHMRLYELKLNNPNNTKKGIEELYKHQLKLHRQGYWWSFHLLPFRCPICHNCTLDQHRAGGWKKLTNRHVPFCLRVFNLDIDPQDEYSGYILV